ncbi:MAG: PAS domain S-box protein [Bacteroidota bacterium]
MTDKKFNIDNNSTFTRELNTINDKVLNFAILISALFSIPALLSLMSRIFVIGIKPIQYVYFILAILIIALYLLKSKFNFKTRLFIFLSMLIVLVLSGQLGFGMIGFWANNIILIVLLISLFYKNIYSFITLGIIVSITILVAYLYSKKYLILDFDILVYLNSYSVWSAMISSFIFISLITIFTIGRQRTFFISTIKELTFAKEKAQKSEQKFKNIFNSSIDGIVISDFEGQILEANKALTSFIGVTEDNLKNKTVRDFVLPEYHAIMKERTESLVPNESPPLLEMLVKNFKNETVPVEINMILIDYNNDKAVFSVVRDITERKKIEQKILSTIIQTEEKERSRFAKELHDGVGPLLSATKIYAKAIPSADNEEERFH